MYVGADKTNFQIVNRIFNFKSPSQVIDECNPECATCINQARNCLTCSDKSMTRSII